MKVEEARKHVVDAGRKLVESGLIARTWGNVSCRIDQDSFVITPSGRDYLSLTPDQIVTVRISDGSYEGTLKPSSEKGMHAQIYQLYDDVTFIIHTHQENASVISATKLHAVTIPETSERAAMLVPCAEYALPGTAKLRRNIAKALVDAGPSASAAIMRNHGAVCFGKDATEAFSLATQLEKVCEKLVQDEYMRRSGDKIFDAYQMTFLGLTGKKNDVPATDKTLYHSRRTPLGFTLYDDDTEIDVDKQTKAQSVEASVYDVVYKNNRSINHILFTRTPEILAIANSGVTLKPMLDDFAQIAGRHAAHAQLVPDSMARAVAASSVVLVPGYGALCCGKTLTDAEAAVLVAQKNSKALAGASIFSVPKPINPLECFLMHLVYVRKYSKQINK